MFQRIDFKRTPSTMMKSLVLLLLLLESCASALRHCSSDERQAHPHLCEFVRLRITDPARSSQLLHEWAQQHNLLVNMPAAVPAIVVKNRQLEPKSDKDTDDILPVVMAHGMGDSCFNDGMQSITQRISALLGDGAYSTCVPTGSSQSEDTNNGYFLSMNDSVDVFAAKIKDDPLLKGGFNAMGFSQGNNVIRGYIAKYNDPPVHTFVSVNGVNAGEGAVPYCIPSSSLLRGGWSLCDLLMEQASNAAYTDYAQSHSFQANYWRDPRESEFATYQKYSQLAEWNNEVPAKNNQTLNNNWALTEKFVWIMATKDGMVWPKEGEQWGAPDPKDPFSTILKREDTAWFKEDLFGLRTAEEAGKNHYESFEGDHLKFKIEEFDAWVHTYFS